MKRNRMIWGASRWCGPVAIGCLGCASACGGTVVPGVEAASDAARSKDAQHDGVPDQSASDVPMDSIPNDGQQQD